MQNVFQTGTHYPRYPSQYGPNIPCPLLTLDIIFVYSYILYILYYCFNNPQTETLIQKINISHILKLLISNQTQVKTHYLYI